MTSIRLDRVIYSSLHPAFLNYADSTGSIVVEATSLANGATRNISTNINFDRGSTVADIYATRGTIKTLITGGGRAAASVVYNFKSTETATFNTVYTTNGVTVTLSITNNTGGAITPNAQTIEIKLVQYDAPISI